MMLNATAASFDEYAVREFVRKRTSERLGNASQAANEKPLGSATLFVWQDPATIPRRQWLHAGHYVRGFLSATVAPGGLGKSANAIMEALAMVTGRPLPIRGLVGKKLRVWYVNGDDDLIEIKRRFAAAMLYFKIDPEEVEGRLFIDSADSSNFVFGSEDRNGVKISAPVVESVVASMQENKIDCLILDPFVAFHAVNEQSNGSIQQIATQLAVIAKTNNAAVELVAHTRKLNGVETTADSTRGASALHDKTRSLRTINRMTEAEGEKACLDPGRCKSIIRIDFGKHNLTKGGADSQWRELVSVPLGNGDDIAVADGWSWPSLAETSIDLSPEQIDALRARLVGQQVRADWRADSWIGYEIAAVMGLDASENGQKKKLLRLQESLIDAGHLTVMEGRDGQRRPRNYVVARDAVSSAPVLR